MHPPSRRLPKTSRMRAMSVSVASEGLSDGHETEFSTGTARKPRARPFHNPQARSAVKQSKDIFAASGGHSQGLPVDPYEYADGGISCDDM